MSAIIIQILILSAIIGVVTLLRQNFYHIFQYQFARILYYFLYFLALAPVAFMTFEMIDLSSISCEPDCDGGQAVGEGLMLIGFIGILIVSFIYQCFLYNIIPDKETLLNNEFFDEELTAFFVKFKSVMLIVLILCPIVRVIIAVLGTSIVSPPTSNLP